MYSVRVKPNYRWSSVQVGGRIFSKFVAHELNEFAINDEILNSPLLDVEEIAPSNIADSPEINATNGAVEFATKAGLDLANITGTGEDGRILKRDVEAYLSEVTDDTQG